MDLYDVRRVDALLGASLERLAAAHSVWAAAGDPAAPMLVDGTPIDDLCLTFVLPGALRRMQRLLCFPAYSLGVCSSDCNPAYTENCV